MRSIVVAGVGVVARLGATRPTPQPPPTAVVAAAAGRDGPEMEGDCAGEASAEKIPPNFR